ncbi:MAG TPA: glucosaminidase domain-containing protein [Chitinophaga sp.]|uniref:glucosaminidase domain-containing protein n=1 Tax=Chitinophaga sp. TaxID=1869181 RepID=UPI002BFCE82D|nr:glucosaminidase domain-containing protein [Chitinophaga sp.]HVI43729.1 glucosaminidase domain-containing protein [Chitinophaga sp.]
MINRIAVLSLLTFMPVLLYGQNISFPPTPNEDKANGMNDNCYLSATGHPTEAERNAFILSLKPYIDSLAPHLNLPPKTIMAMAIIESGCGFTRIGYYANNLFGIKKITADSIAAYVLKGQPDEFKGKYIRIIERTSKGQLVFDESIRMDNRYRKFPTRQDCILYLAGTLLQNQRYKPAIVNYQQNLRKGMSGTDASVIYAYDIANLGYNHKGGNYYRNAIQKVIKKYNL